MTQFDFEITGACGPCCIANVPAYIDINEHKGSFTITHAELSPDYQRLIVHIAETDAGLEGDVERYLISALAESHKYELIPKKRSLGQPDAIQSSAFRYWLFAILGLGSGITLLILSLVVGSLSWPVTVGIAILSSILTLALGMDSFRTVKMDFDNRQPGMDSLFAMSTATALAVSLLALFIPGLPMMFEVGPLIFGFRHLGIAIKKSMYAAQGVQAQYDRLVSTKTFKKRIGLSEEDVVYTDLRPGDVLNIAAGDMIPVNGWLYPPNDAIESIYELDVYMVEGSTIPRTFARDEAVYAGMIAKKPCLMRVGLANTLYFFSESPNKRCELGDIQVYLDNNAQITVVTPTQTHLVLSSRDLTTIQGQDLSQDIATALRLKTMHQLSAAPLRQQLSRGILNHATTKNGLTQTASALRQMNEDIKQSALTKAPIQKKADNIYRIFVPLVMGIAIGSGVILAFFFPAMIALHCFIYILVSACPCTLGFIMPLVMELARQKALKEHIVFHESEAIENLAKVNRIAMDLHRTLTEGKPDVLFQYPKDGDVSQCETDETILKDINTYLALLEQFSTHFTGMTIYAAIKGDELLKQNTKELQPASLTQTPEGVTAIIDGQHYLLGNCDLMARHGYILPSGMTYLIRASSNGYQLLTSILIQDTLRPDAAKAVDYCRKQLGVEIDVITGGDAATADYFAPKLSLNKNRFYVGRSGGASVNESNDTLIEKPSKESVILQFQEQGDCVLMVGDGPNDARALKQADVGMIMNYPLEEYCDLQPHAQARILNGEVMAVVKAIEIAKQAMASVEQNLWFSLVYNLVSVSLTIVLLLGFGIVLHPGIGAALMVIQTCVIIFNVYRLHLEPLPCSKIMSSEGLRRNGLFSASHDVVGVDDAVSTNDYCPVLFG